MFGTDHFVHFVLDFYNETHYTDTLLALSPEAYVWYELRKQNIDNALFVSEGGSGLRLGAYDPESVTVMRAEKKKFWGKSQTETDPVARHVTLTPQELGVDADELLGWLLDRQEAQRNKRVALVMTQEAFQSLYQDAREKDRQRLARLCSRPAGRDLLLIRVPMTARDMGKAFLEGKSPLRQLCPGVVQAAAGPREPLMDALNRQLDRQIFHAWRITEADIRGILLRNALIRGDWTENIHDLEDLAVCLQGTVLSWDHCPTRQEVSAYIQNDGVLEEHRQIAARLRQTYPGMSLSDAMMRETVNLRGPSPLQYQSNLAKNVRTLVLPEEFLREYPRWLVEMETVRETCLTVWNKPLNRKACEFAESFCNDARVEADRQDWETLNDALNMLRFCSGELCGDAAHDDGLSAICEEGRLIINKSHNLFRQPNAFSEIGKNGSIFDRKLNQTAGIITKANQAVDSVERAELQTMRLILRDTIADFGKRHVSRDAISRLFEAAEARMSRKLDNVADNIDFFDTREQPRREPMPEVRQEEPDAYEDFSFGEFDEEPDTAQSREVRAMTPEEREKELASLEKMFDSF